MPKRGPTCAFTGCKSLAQRIVGDCGECGKKFCSTHRMLESHECVGLANAAASAKAQNTAKLEGEATKYNKVDRDFEWCMNKMSGAKGFGENKQALVSPKIPQPQNDSKELKPGLAQSPLLVFTNGPDNAMFSGQSIVVAEHQTLIVQDNGLCALGS
ncbi:hypothetical protein LTR86_004593 [Recurvomyces mirabilis]|nr:hypothetical protein LTR86_004593 [Recurvomyces mirabilis]